MKRPFLTLAALTFLIPSCVTNAGEPNVQGGLQAQSSFLLTQPQRNKIGQKIWENESGAKIIGLTAWNKGEDFPSLGIGHFIWYPKGVRAGFTESFPQFVQFAQQRGLTLPAVALQPDCPWGSKAQFEAEFYNPTMSGLRKWLASHLTVQADFIIAKSQASLGKVLQVVPAADRARVQYNYQKVSTTPNGTYALIDYVNFKGEGINPSERYQGQGWGLLQVLQGMNNVSSGQAAAVEFAESAKRALGNRIKNSPAERGESRWKSGWYNRCNTYKKPL